MSETQICFWQDERMDSFILPNGTAGGGILYRLARMVPVATVVGMEIGCGSPDGCPATAVYHGSLSRHRPLAYAHSNGGIRVGYFELDRAALSIHAVRGARLGTAAAPRTAQFPLW